MHFITLLTNSILVGIIVRYCQNHSLIMVVLDVLTAVYLVRKVSVNKQNFLFKAKGLGLGFLIFSNLTHHKIHTTEISAPKPR